MANLVTSADLGIYLGTTIDSTRGDFILAQAQALAESIVSPLPAGASAIILAVAARAFTNPSNATSETTGPFAVTHGAVAGGLWLSRADKAALRRFAGGGGVFTFETMPANAGQGLPLWDRNVYMPDEIAYDWDVHP